ncbi:hypothetical protein BGX33_002458 [Mortierella sp. NVP41]|nr:hypothetical protein BGX33_002458 [Mortierella sp. NVP41]
MITKHWKDDGSSEYVFLDSAATGALRTYGHHIESLKLDEGTDSDFLAQFLEHAPPTFPRLTSAEFHDPVSDDVVADLIGRGTGGWRKFVVHEYYYVGEHFRPKSIEALLKHASTLAIVRLEIAPCLKSRDIHRLLCSAPNLKELYLLSEWRTTDIVDRYLDAQDVAKSDWVCLSLEVFGCEIGNIPRPDITRWIDCSSPTQHVVGGTIQESIDLQRRVYAQLGRLTQLRELRLGIQLPDGRNYGYRDYYRLYDCLAMTLKSGLDLLKNLKELRFVGLDDMEVHIYQDKEQEWIKENWPKVEIISYSVYE